MLSKPLIHSSDVSIIHFHKNKKLFFPSHHSFSSLTVARPRKENSVYLLIDLFNFQICLFCWKLML
jgi:hypothetical protein